MIIPLEKVLFFGTKKELDLFFDRAQSIGQIQFQSMEGKKIRPVSNAIEETLHAMRILRQEPAIEQLQNELLSGKECVNTVLSLQEGLDRVQEEKRILKIDIERCRPFGEFSIADLKLIERDGKQKVQFFSRKANKEASEEIEKRLIFVASENNLDYFLSISKEPISHPNLHEFIFTESLSQKKQRYQKFQHEESHLDHELKMMAQYYDLLVRYLDQLLDNDDLRFSKGLSADVVDGMLFAVEAWVPSNRQEWKEAIKDLTIEVEHVKIEEKETPPTYMENSGTSKIGEDLVYVYDTPSIHDKDPSLYVLIFFTLFFSMIVADAGYGLIYLAVALFLKFKFKQVGALAKRIIKLMVILSCGCVVWGMMAGSYFSIKMGPENPLNRSSLLYQLAKVKANYEIEVKGGRYNDWVQLFPELKEVPDANTFLIKGVKIKDGVPAYVVMDDLYNSILLEIALLVGMLHIIISLIRGIRNQLTGIGWIIFIFGAYLYFPIFINATTFINEFHILSPKVAQSFGLQLIFAGIGIAVLFAIIKQGFMGIFELFTSIQIFADVLSYLRIYALGLASMILASTFNGLAAQAGLGGGLLILLIGHGLNLNLAIMGGLIHGLRLNFLEWYRYCFEGGGRPFIPLIKRSSLL